MYIYYTQQYGRQLRGFGSNSKLRKTLEASDVSMETISRTQLDELDELDDELQGDMLLYESQPTQARTIMQSSTSQSFSQWQHTNNSNTNTNNDNNQTPIVPPTPTKPSPSIDITVQSPFKLLPPRIAPTTRIVLAASVEVCIL